MLHVERMNISPRLRLFRPLIQLHQSEAVEQLYLGTSHYSLTQVVEWPLGSAASGGL